MNRSPTHARSHRQEWTGSRSRHGQHATAGQSMHLQMDRLGGYATLGLTAMYAAAEGAGFDATTSHRIPSEALLVATESGADRLVHHSMLGLASRRDDATILDIAALSDEIHSEFDSLGAGLQRCAMLVADPDDAIAEFGHTAPQTGFIREVYAAAAVAAASEGTPVAALEPLFHTAPAWNRAAYTSSPPSRTSSTRSSTDYSSRSRTTPST